MLSSATLFNVGRKGEHEHNGRQGLNFILHLFRFMSGNLGKTARVGTFDALVFAGTVLAERFVKVLLLVIVGRDAP
jgi:hypothetical protein